jgi:hypothetical protein
MEENIFGNATRPEHDGRSSGSINMDCFQFLCSLINGGQKAVPYYYLSNNLEVTPCADFQACRHFLDRLDNFQAHDQISSPQPLSYSTKPNEFTPLKETVTQLVKLTSWMSRTSKFSHNIPYWEAVALATRRVVNQQQLSEYEAAVCQYDEQQPDDQGQSSQNNSTQACPPRKIHNLTLRTCFRLSVTSRLTQSWRLARNKLEGNRESRQ